MGRLCRPILYLDLGRQENKFSGRLWLLQPRLDVHIRPNRQLSQQWFKRPPERRDGVFHLWGHLRTDGTQDDPIRFQLAQLRRQHSLRQSQQQPSKFSETLRSVENVEDQDRLPFPANNVERRLDRTVSIKGVPLLARHVVCPLLTYKYDSIGFSCAYLRFLPESVNHRFNETSTESLK